MRHQQIRKSRQPTLLCRIHQLKSRHSNRNGCTRDQALHAPHVFTQARDEEEARNRVKHNNNQATKQDTQVQEEFSCAGAALALLFAFLVATLY